MSRGLRPPQVCKKLGVSEQTYARWRKILYVFDKQSGKLLREIEVPGHAAASPITYLYRGKQHFAMAVGGNEDAAVVALALLDARVRCVDFSDVCPEVTRSP